jgi:hypothetical protein
MNRYVTELIGTFFLVFAIGLSSGPMAPLAIGSITGPLVCSRRPRFAIS